MHGSVTEPMGARKSLAYYSAWLLENWGSTLTNQEGIFLLFKIMEDGKSRMFFLKSQRCFIL